MMNKILTIAAILFSSICSAQRTDIVNVSHDTSVLHLQRATYTIPAKDTSYEAQIPVLSVSHDSLVIRRFLIWYSYRIIKTTHDTLYFETKTIYTQTKPRDTTITVANWQWQNTTHDSAVYVPAKPHLKSFATRQEDFLNDTSIVDVAYFKQVPNVVLKIDWRKLQPAENAVDVSYINAYLNWARRANAKYGLNIHFKLRIATGVFAPDWLKQKAGSFKLTKGDWATDPDNVCVRWWVPEFKEAWTNLQFILAAKYDDEALIAEVVMSATSAKTGEALIRAVNETGKWEYLNAGYTNELDLNAVYDCIDAMAVWNLTNIGISISPWQVFSKTQRVTEETNTSKAVALYLCDAAGARAVLGNNGLRTASGNNGDDWAPGGIMHDLGRFFQQCVLKYNNGIFYQTASVDRQNSDIRPVITAGINFGAACIELPQTQRKIVEYISLSELEVYNQYLK